MTTRCALYVRVSTAEQVREGYSVRAQEARLLEWAERDGYEVVEAIVDEGLSGRDANRRGLRRVVELAAAGQIDVVLTWKRDRMFRSIQHRRNHEEILKEYGVRLLATDDTGNRIADTVLDAVAEEESERIRARTQEGLTRKALEGKVIRGMKSPYGFVSGGERGGTLEVFEPEMEVVRRILRMIGGEGLSARVAAGTLDREGVKSPLAAEAERRGKVLDVVPFWSQTTIRNLVNSDLYKPHEPEEVERLVVPEVAARLRDGHVYGLWTWNRRKTSKKLREDGETYEHSAVVRPEEEWLRVPVDITEARLERGLVDAARLRLKRRSPKPSEAAGRTWPLRGLVRCPDCGSVLSPQTVTRKRADGGTAKTFYYACRRRYNNSRRDCDYRKNWPAEELESLVWEKVGGWMVDPEEIVAGLDRLIDRERDRLGGDPGREERHWLDRLADVDRRMERLQDAALDTLVDDGVVDRDRLTRKLGELREQRGAAEDGLRAARGRGERISSLESMREFYAGDGWLWEGVAEGMPDAPIEEWKAAYREDYRRGMTEQLETWTPEQRHAHYAKLGLTVKVRWDNGVELEGVFVSPANTPWRR